MVVVPWMLYDPAPHFEQLSMLAWSEAVVVSAMAFPLAHIAQLPKPAMLVAVLTDCDMPLIVYVPVKPVPVRKTVIVVPVVMPVPEIVWPTAIAPTDTAVTVNVVPEIVPVNTTLVVPAMLVAVLTVCVALTVYVPTPPVPVARALIVVPVVMPVPEIVWPTAIAPTDTAVTVNVVPEIVPVNTTLVV